MQGLSGAELNEYARKFRGNALDLFQRPDDRTQFRELVRVDGDVAQPRVAGGRAEIEPAESWCAEY